MRALAVETEVPAQVIVDPLISQRAQENDERERRPQKLGTEDRRPVEEVECSQLGDDVVDPGSLVTNTSRGEPPTQSVFSRRPIRGGRETNRSCRRAKSYASALTKRRGASNHLHHPGWAKPIAGPPSIDGPVLLLQSYAASLVVATADRATGQQLFSNARTLDEHGRFAAATGTERRHRSGASSCCRSKGTSTERREGGGLKAPSARASPRRHSARHPPTSKA